MGNYLVLEGAEILEAQGWGGTPGGTFSIQFEDTGCLSVYKQGIFGSKKLISMGFWYLEIVVGTVGIQTGGGFVGGGFGVAGAVRGIAAASLLNALTTKNSEYAVLTTFLTEPNGTEKMCAFGFKHKRESLLRDELAEVIPVWVEPHVRLTESALLEGPSEEEEAEDLATMFGSAYARGMLTDQQVGRLMAGLHASQESTVLQWEEAIRQDPTAGDKAEMLMDAIVEKRDRQFFSIEQSDRLLKALKDSAPGAFRPIPMATPTASGGRLDQLKALAELRSSGALTEEEFQSEKCRILAES